MDPVPHGPTAAATMDERVQAGLAELDSGRRSLLQRWLEMLRLALTRDLKRMELRVSLLSESLDRRPPPGKPGHGSSSGDSS